MIAHFQHVILKEIASYEEIHEYGDNDLSGYSQQGNSNELYNRQTIDL